MREFKDGKHSLEALQVFEIEGLLTKAEELLAKKGEDWERETRERIAEIRARLRGGRDA